MQIGTKVKMTDKFKQELISHDCADHVKEFGDCVGVVIRYTDYNNCKPEDPQYDHSKIGPEVDIRWQPSNLKYAYHPNNLIIV